MDDARDRLRRSTLRDEIWASDRKREHVTCGAGFDVAHVDPQDVVAPDCEVVKRP
jgi:hypothetical protein